MSFGTPLNPAEAAKVNSLAVTRDYISQPRISKFYPFFGLHGIKQNFSGLLVS